MSRIARMGCIAIAVICAASSAGLSISNVDLQMNPSGNVPLAGICTFETDAPAVPVIRISDGLAIEEVPSSETPGTQHRVILLGFRPDTTHTVYVGAKGAGGASAEPEAIEVVTGILPYAFPPVRVLTSSPSEMEPGVILVPTIRWPLTGPSDQSGLAFVLNAKGEVIWYYVADHGVTEIRRAQNGNFLYQSGRRGHQYEIDVLGNIVTRWHASGTPKENLHEESIAVATDSFHHDFFEKPDGNILQLSTELRDMPDWYTSDTDANAKRETAKVIGDVLVEHKRTGEIVREWKMFDLLDPYRLGYGSLNTGFYAETYKGVLEKPAYDWLHTNAVFYLPEEDAAVFSAYNLDLLYKIDLATGKLKWLLGDPEGWAEQWQPYILKPKGDMKWPRHQHAIKRTPVGTYLIYDNGTNGARPFNERKQPPDVYSRAVEYRVDEANMTVEEVWSYGGPKDEVFISSFICEADWMPSTGNIVIADGGRTRPQDGSSDADAGFSGQHWARIFEVTRTSPPVKVFEVEFKAVPPEGWAVYRSERLPSLYP